MPRKPWRKYPWNKTIQYWLRHNFAIEHEKSIQALVYVGAAFLVIIVGLRGLGDISNTSYIPKFLLNQDGKIDSSIVMIGLLVEFIMLCLLAAVSFFSPRDKDDNLQTSINELAGSVETLAAGAAATSRENGHPMPDTDGENRAFPGNLAGKYMILSVAGGVIIPGNVTRVEVKFYQRTIDGLDLLYETNQEMNMYSIYFAGVSIEGYLQQVAGGGDSFTYRKVMRQLWSRDVFE